MVNLCMKNFPILIRSFVSSCRFQIKPGCSLFFLNNVVPDLNLPIPFLHWGIEMTNRFIWMAATKNFVFLKYFVVLSNSSKKVIKKDVYLAVRRSGPFLTFFLFFIFTHKKAWRSTREALNWKNWKWLSPFKTPSSLYYKKKRKKTKERGRGTKSQNRWRCHFTVERLSRFFHRQMAAYYNWSQTSSVSFFHPSVRFPA